MRGSPPAVKESEKVQGEGSESYRASPLVYWSRDPGAFNSSSGYEINTLAVAATDHTVAPVFCVVTRLQFLLWPPGGEQEQAGLPGRQQFLPPPTKSSAASGMRGSRKQVLEGVKR